MTTSGASIIDMNATGGRIPRARRRRPYNVLFTCIGRRVSLLRAFRAAARRLRLTVGVFGTDTTELSPALQCCDQGFLTRPVQEPHYREQLHTIVQSRRIDLIVPTVDLDLALLAEARERWATRYDCRVLVSAPAVIGLCQDKRRTARFLERHGFGVPRTVSPRRILDGTIRLPWPCLVKPWDGYAGRANRLAHNREELRFFSRRIPHAICQPFIEGTEYTCDAYVDGRGECRCVVPRQRMEVRAGEVSKARIVKDLALMEEVARLVTTMGAGPGVVTVQVIVTPDRERVFIEINPRFGGGAPLSIQSGADFPYWLLAEMAGRRPRIQWDGFAHGLTMLRYDDELWVSP